MKNINISLGIGAVSSVIFLLCLFVYFPGILTADIVGQKLGEVQNIANTDPLIRDIEHLLNISKRGSITLFLVTIGYIAQNLIIYFIVWRGCKKAN